MTDTPPDVARRYRELLLARSGAERLRMGCDMFDAARSLVRSSLAGTPEPGLRAALFLRIYGRDFDAAERRRIAAALDAER